MTYLDAASGLPLHPAGRAALLAALDDGWADPTRLYREGRRARALLDAARETVAEVLAVRPDEVAFTGSGTQAAQLALLGAARGARAGRTGTVVTSAVEHSAVLAAADAWVAAGGTAARIGVDAVARVDLEAFAAAVAAPGVAVASLQAANHEVGTRQPVAAALEACRSAGVALHVDAAHVLGRDPVAPAADLLSGSARLWGGPPGVGVLVVRRGTRWRSPLPETEAEGGRVPGGVGLPAVLAAAAALQARAAESGTEGPRLHDLTAGLRDRLAATIPDIDLLGDPVDRLPHLVAFSCLYVAGEALATGLDRLGYSVSSGSSCTASAEVPSHVLVAMGALTHGNIRVSLPGPVTAEELDGFAAATAEEVASLRTILGADGL